MEFVTLTPTHITEMNQVLDLFSAAFEDPESYDRHRPSRAYLERLLAGPTFIALGCPRGGASGWGAGGLHPGEV